MAHRLIWSPQSLRELGSLTEYLEAEAPLHARSVIFQILAKAESTIEFPLRGRVVPEFRESSIREVFVFSYRLIYRVSDDCVEIVSIFHGHRLLRPDAGKN